MMRDLLMVIVGYFPLNCSNKLDQILSACIVSKYDVHALWNEKNNNQKTQKNV